MEGVQAVHDGDVSKLGVVWTRRNLQGVPTAQNQLLTLQIEQTNSLVDVLGQDTSQSTTIAS